MKVIKEVSDKYLRILMFHYTSLYIYATFVCIPSAFELLENIFFKEFG